MEEIKIEYLYLYIYIILSIFLILIIILLYQFVGYFIVVLFCLLLFIFILQILFFKNENFAGIYMMIIYSIFVLILGGFLSRYNDDFYKTNQQNSYLKTIFGLIFFGIFMSFFYISYR
jgi:hypothetical protein